MSWQKCPICNGTGIEPGPFTTSNSTPICTICQGKKIISELTGLPPSYSIGNFTYEPIKWIEPDRSMQPKPTDF